MSVWRDALNGNISLSADELECGAKKNEVVVDVDTGAIRFVAKRADGGEDGGPCGGGIEFVFKEDCTDEGGGVANTTKIVVVSGEVGCGGRSPNMQNRDIKGTRRIIVTSGASLDDVGDGGLGGGHAGQKDTGEGLENLVIPEISRLEEAGFLETIATKIDPGSS
jgi:hypothetical protein